MARRVRNQGSLIHRKKEGRWEARLILDGKRRSFYGKDAAEALSKLNNARHDVEHGLPIPDGKGTLGAFLTNWVKGVPNLRQGSWQRYETIVRVHLAPAPFGRIPLLKLTKQQVLAFYAQKQQEGLSSTTVGHIHTVLRRALNDALDDNHVQRNVCRQIKAPRRANHEMVTLSQDDARKLLIAAKSSRLLALYALALATGMRQGELLGLHWKDVTLEGPKPSLQVRMQAVEVRTPEGYRTVLDETKTQGSRRKIDLGPSIVRELKAHKARQELEKRIAGDAWQEQGLVFPTRTGGLSSAHPLIESFKRLIKKAELPEMRFHDLRHTAATLALERGENPKAVAEMLGDTVKTVLSVYAHVTPTMQKSLAATMDSVLWAGNS